jgi:hypothetical protein
MSYDVKYDPDVNSDSVDVYDAVVSSYGTSAYVDFGLGKNNKTYDFPLNEEDISFFDRLKSPLGVGIGFLVVVTVVCLILWLTVYEHSFEDRASYLFIFGVIVPGIVSLILWGISGAFPSSGMNSRVERYILERRREARKQK